MDSDPHFECGSGYRDFKNADPKPWNSVPERRTAQLAGREMS